MSGALVNYVEKGNFESFEITSATNAFTLSSYYCYMYNNHVHIECYGTVNQTITSAFDHPLIVIPDKYKPYTRYSTKIGSAGIDEDFYPSLAVIKNSDNKIYLYQSVTGTLNNGKIIKFICDYIMESSQ